MPNNDLGQNIDKQSSANAADAKDNSSVNDAESSKADEIADQLPREYGGPSGPEPTRYGDWERKGRCVDF